MVAFSTSADPISLTRELTVNEAAEVLGVCTKTVRRYLAGPRKVSGTFSVLARADFYSQLLSGIGLASTISMRT